MFLLPGQLKIQLLPAHRMVGSHASPSMNDEQMLKNGRCPLRIKN